MDNIPEREQPKQERVISLGQDFYPFDPEYTNQWISPMEVKVYDSSISLNLTDTLRIPLIIEANSSKTPKGNCITPFDPDIGYRIDSEDLELDSRLRKTERLKDELDKIIDFSKAPVYLGIQADDTTLNELGLNEEAEVRYKFSEDMLTLLTRLRVLVFFPTGLYMASPWKTTLGFGELDFNYFYPADTGPLPIESDDDLGLDEGFSLFLPSDPGKLAQIRARFVLAEEQPDENPNNQAPNTK